MSCVQLREPVAACSYFHMLRATIAVIEKTADASHIQSWLAHKRTPRFSNLPGRGVSGLVPLHRVMKDTRQIPHHPRRRGIPQSDVARYCRARPKDVGSEMRISHRPGLPHVYNNNAEKSWIEIASQRNVRRRRAAASNAVNHWCLRPGSCRVPTRCVSLASNRPRRGRCTLTYFYW